MTHLLTRLAERTLGTVQAARPVITPMFAPGPRLTGSDQPGDALEEIIESVDSGQQARPQPSSIAPRPVPSTSNAHQQPAILPERPVPEISSTEMQQRASKHIPLSNEISSATSAGIPAPRAESVALSHAPAQEMITLLSANNSILQIEAGSASSTEARPAGETLSPTGNMDRAPAKIAQVENIAYPLVSRIPVDRPVLSRDMPEQPLVTHIVEQERKAGAPPIYSILEQNGQTHREKSPASVPNQPTRPVTVHSQSVVYEVTEMQLPPDSPLQEQGKRPIETNVQGISTHPYWIEKRDAPSDDTVTLVPARSDTQMISQQVTKQVRVDDQSERDPAGAINRITIQSPGEMSQRVVEKHGQATGEAPSDVPTIRVTIGRIDVRAVMPAPPTPRPKAARSGPKISLEEYNRQNKGGR